MTLVGKKQMNIRLTSNLISKIAQEIIKCDRHENGRIGNMLFLKPINYLTYI